MNTIKKWEKRIINPGEAHLWVYQDNGGVFPTRSLEVLDIQEKKRYEQYLSAEKKREFLIGKIFTKHILAQYLDIYPSRVRFEQSEGDRPTVLNLNLNVSLSHSNSYFVCLISLNRVGVDVEYTGRKILKSGFEHVFTEEEILKLNALEGEAKIQYFFKLWTMKEAFWKAYEYQRSLSFNQFSISLDPLKVEDSLGKIDTKSWQLSFHEEWDDFLIASAIEKKSDELLTLSTFTFEPRLQESLFAYP